MSELSLEARKLIEGAAAADSPSELDRQRIKQRLSLELGAAAFAATGIGAAAVGSGAAAASAGNAAHAGTGLSVVKSGVFSGFGKLALALGLLGAAGTTALIATRPQPAPSPTKQPAIAAPALPASEAVAPPAAPQPAAEAIAAPAAPETAPPEGRPAVAPAPVPAKRQVPAKPVAAAPVQDLQAELELLAQAQSALREGQHDRALALVHQHAERFPQGSMREERLVLGAIARCARGEDGASVIGELARRVPASPLLVRARTACGVP